MMIFVWWFVLGYVPTATAAALLIAALRGPYSYRPRHGAPGRRRARTSTWERAASVVVDDPEVRVARVRVEETAAQIETRAALWNDGRTGTELAEAYLGITGIEHVAEIERYEQSAGSPAYLAVTARGVVRMPEPENERERVELRDERITTADMTARFGAELGPALARGAQLDEWVMPDDPGIGRHARRGRRASAGVA
jgi:hypothetical protein